MIADGVVVGAGEADFDESLLTGEADAAPKRAGDPVYSGSFVISGKVHYEAQKVGVESFANKLAAGARQFAREVTPLQREVNLFVRILLLLVLYFGVLIAVQYFLSGGVTLLQSVQAVSYTHLDVYKRQIMDEQPTVVDAPDAAHFQFKGGHVEFDDVDFSYVPGRKILKHNSFEALPGQMIGICGPTGAGKSTIINILTRYYDLDSGAIRIDGQEISQLTQESLRKQLSLIHI